MCMMYMMSYVQYVVSRVSLTYFCNTLQHTATHCNTLQHSASHVKHVVSRVSLTYFCNTLQHIATHCNTLHHMSNMWSLTTSLTYSCTSNMCINICIYSIYIIHKSYMCVICGPSHVISHISLICLYSYEYMNLQHMYHTYIIYICICLVQELCLSPVILLYVKYVYAYIYVQNMHHIYIIHVCICLVPTPYLSHIILLHIKYTYSCMICMIYPCISNMYIWI